MPRILITAAGTGTAFGYAQAKARWFPEIALFTGDVNSAEEVTSSLYAERHFVLPPSAADDYLKIVEGLLRQWAIDAYIPLIDSEVAQASILLDMWLARIVCNGRDFSVAATAKSRYGEWLEVEGATALRPLARADVRDGVRLVAKRDGGFGGRVTQIVESAQVAGALLQEGWSLYPYIEGDEFTVDCFPLNGRAVTSVRQRLEVKSGVCTKARIFHDETLASIALYLCQRFALTEPFCFQTRKADGLHYLIDINPRLGAGTAMSALNGTDFFAAHLACLSGRSPMEFLRPRFAECVVTRQYSEYLMSASL